MAYVEGEPLSELIPSDGLPPESVIRYGTQIADALAHAHGDGSAELLALSGSVGERRLSPTDDRVHAGSGPSASDPQVITSSVSPCIPSFQTRAFFGSTPPFMANVSGLSVKKAAISAALTLAAGKPLGWSMTRCAT